jgi:hypothetical protein
MGSYDDAQKVIETLKAKLQQGADLFNDSLYMQMMKADLIEANREIARLKKLFGLDRPPTKEQAARAHAAIS